MGRTNTELNFYPDLSTQNTNCRGDPDTKHHSRSGLDLSGYKLILRAKEINYYFAFI